MITKYIDGAIPYKGKKESLVGRINNERTTIMVVTQPFNTRKKFQIFQRGIYIQNRFQWSNLTENERIKWENKAKSFPPVFLPPYAFPSTGNALYLLVNQFRQHIGIETVRQVPACDINNVIPFIEFRLVNKNKQVECRVRPGPVKGERYFRLQGSLKSITKHIEYESYTRLIGYIKYVSNDWVDITQLFMNKLNAIPLEHDVLFFSVYPIDVEQYSRGNLLIGTWQF